MTNDQDKATIRFAVIEKDGKYQVIDTVTGKSLRFSYDRETIPTNGQPTFWNNYYSALGFAKKMAVHHPI